MMKSIERKFYKLINNRFLNIQGINVEITLNDDNVLSFLSCANHEFKNYYVFIDVNGLVRVFPKKIVWSIWTIDNISYNHFCNCRKMYFYNIKI